jgi:hypothetical protein
MLSAIAGDSINGKSLRNPFTTTPPSTLQGPLSASLYPVIRIHIRVDVEFPKNGRSTSESSFFSFQRTITPSHHHPALLVLRF